MRDSLFVPISFCPSMVSFDEPSPSVRAPPVTSMRVMSFLPRQMVMPSLRMVMSPVMLIVPVTLMSFRSLSVLSPDRIALPSPSASASFSAVSNVSPLPSNTTASSAEAAAGTAHTTANSSRTAAANIPRRRTEFIGSAENTRSRTHIDFMKIPQNRNSFRKIR